MDKQNAELTDAFKHIKYYYPEESPAKSLCLFLGLPGAQITIGDGYLGIGLDLFLGADSKFYTAQAITEVSRTIYPAGLRRIILCRAWWK